MESRKRVFAAAAVAAVFGAAYLHYSLDWGDGDDDEGGEQRRGSEPNLPRARILGGVAAIRENKTTGASEFLPISRRENGEHGHFKRKLIPLERGVTLRELGIAESKDWHLSHSALELMGKVSGERGICINSTACYSEMRDLHESTTLHVEIPKLPATGENILVSDEFNLDSVCIGDVIEIEGLDSIRLTVTCVRVPCKRYKMYYNSKAVYERIFRRGLAGFFVKVQGTGRLTDAHQSLRVVKRPHPNWTLRRLYSLLYGQGDPESKTPKWVGTKDELQELLGIPELMDFQYKDRLKELVKQSAWLSR